MTPEERFRRLVIKLDISVRQMAEIFGVESATAQDWYFRKRKMQPEFQGTLLRLEAENLPKLAPGISARTTQAFYTGRARNRA